MWCFQLSMDVPNVVRNGPRQPAAARAPTAHRATSEKFEKEAGGTEQGVPASTQGPCIHPDFSSARKSPRRNRFAEFLRFGGSAARALSFPHAWQRSVFGYRGHREGGDKAPAKEPHAGAHTPRDCHVYKKKFLILFRISSKISVRRLESFSYQ